MEWNIAYGGKNFAFFASLGEDHKANASRPELLEENEFIFRVWSELSPSRPVYFGGLGAIPLVEIEAYCRLSGIVGDQAYWIVKQVRDIDLLYLDMIDKKKTAGSPQGKKDKHARH